MTTGPEMTLVPTSAFITAQDGLRVHVQEWRPRRRAAALPVVCLPGLARTAADFETLARALAADPISAHRVIALDSRGRGKSQYDRDPANYDLRVELADLLAVLTALEIPRAVFVGTSRGGILTMLLVGLRPAAIAGCVLNDIGPVIEPEGIARIRSYVGKLPQPATFQDGADILRRLFGTQFPKLTDPDWLAFARRTYKQEGARMVPDYDPRLAAILQGVDLEQPLPSLWKEFEGLARVPVLLLRGANSDILSTATLKEMRARHPAMQVIEVADQGHAPILSGAALIEDIVAFIRSCEAAEAKTPPA
jgi:pimeloyl-ACP methyl ester carboxylesterase